MAKWLPPVSLAGVAGYVLHGGFVLRFSKRSAFSSGAQSLSSRPCLAVGAGGAVLTKAWLRVACAVTIGLVVGAAWVEFSMPNDMSVGLIDGVAGAVSNYGVEFIGPLVVATAVGESRRVLLF
jgi:hypothetical protein